MKYSGFTLDAFQETAIRHMQAGRSVLVCAPTGTGKTIVADWIVDQALSSGRRVVYTAPIKALSNQKYRDYCRLHGDDNVGLVTGDLVIRRDAPARVMTTEILRNMLLGGEPLDDLLAVVLDEIHFLDDRERGTVWEEVLIYLPKTVQILGLSATLSNVRQFAQWLGDVREAPVEVVEEHRRAVPLKLLLAERSIGIVTPEDYEKKAARHQPTRPPTRGRGDRRGRRDRGAQARKTWHSDVVRDLIDEDLLPALYFAFSRRNIESYARHSARTLEADLLGREEREQVVTLLNARSHELGPALDPGLRGMYERGIGFHHAGLHVQLKALVEELYEARLIQLLYCTSTFALGINMPARTVVFDELEKYDGQRVSPLTSRQFVQKAGRAGRRGMDDVGHVVVRADFFEWPKLRPLLDRYKRGQPEAVHSSFSLSWNSIVNLIRRLPPADVRAVVEKSFLNWHLTFTAEMSIRRAEELEDAAEGGRRGGGKQLKEAQRLRRRAEAQGSQCWQEFEQKVAFLIDIGYVDPDWELNAGGSILRHLQIAEILVTELILRGMLDDLQAPTLFGVLCGLVGELPRSVTRSARLDRTDRDLASEIERVRLAPEVMGAERIGGQPVVWSANLVPLGRMWAEGRDLQFVLDQIESPTDISGDLTSVFRRAKDLIGQLRAVWAEDPTRDQELRELARRVSRDEVEVVD